MSTNPFFLEDSSYKRNIDPVGHYIDQAAKYLSFSSKKTYEECVAFVRKSIKDKTFPQIRDPRINFFERQENGDRVQTEGSLLSYITSSVTAKELIAPTLTTYLNTTEKESLLVSYIDSNVKARSIAKKAQFAAKAEGNAELEKIKNIEQTNRKLSNNAISGAHVSESTPLANKTAHSTLTSNCRSTSGYGNANNEKLLCGNRHYWNSSITLANIVSIVTHTDYQKLQLVIDKYNLKYPTVQEAVDCVTYSSDNYWLDQKALEEITTLFKNLTPIELAAFVYVGDIYHLMKYNDSVVRFFIAKLSAKKTTGGEIDSLKILKNTHEDYLNLAHQICADEVKGIGKNYSKIEGTQSIITLASTVKNIEDVLTEYSDLIQALWTTDNMPASVAYFPESVRKAALTSDTDSTIFTVQDWVEWYKGYVGFDQESMAVAATMIFLASQSICHVLAQMSANFGIEQKRLRQVAMKNEFKFDIFVPTNVAKHYYALISCQEGNVFSELEEEIKGVHLKSSNAPKAITLKATHMMMEIMETVYSGKKISLIKYLTEIANTERDIVKSIKSGDLQYFRLGEIKTPESYIKEPENSPYSHYMLWLEVFAEKYGTFSPPPYQTIKVSTILENQTATTKWLTEMKDKEFAKRMMNWLERNNKKYVPNLMVPVEAVTANGIPEEILDIIDIRKIVYDLCKIFYIVLETLGFYICNDSMTKLVSDFY